jgi:hypothetical protein
MTNQCSNDECSNDQTRKLTNIWSFEHLSLIRHSNFVIRISRKNALSAGLSTGLFAAEARSAVGAVATDYRFDDLPAAAAAVAVSAAERDER